MKMTLASSMSTYVLNIDEQGFAIYECAWILATSK